MERADPGFDSVSRLIKYKFNVQGNISKHCVKVAIFCALWKLEAPTRCSNVRLQRRLTCCDDFESL